MISNVITSYWCHKKTTYLRKKNPPGFFCLWSSQQPHKHNKMKKAMYHATLIAPPTKMNAQENDFHLSALPLTDTTRGHGTGVPSCPGPISETCTRPWYSLLGAELCRTSPWLGGWGTPRGSHQGFACPSYPPIPCVVPGSYIGSISQLYTLPPY